MKEHRHLACEELKSKMDAHKDFILVDVLSAGDYKNAHITGAINIPLDELPQKANQWLNRSIDIIVYSSNGGCRGAEFAQEKLGKMGFRVWTLDGGLDAWQRSYYPLEGNPNYKPHPIIEKPASLEEKPKAIPLSAASPSETGAQRQRPEGQRPTGERPIEQRPAGQRPTGGQPKPSSPGTAAQKMGQEFKKQEFRKKKAA